jgi:chemotaxis family two-component system response regulator Rcp1
VAEDNYPDALLVREVVREKQLPFEIHVVSDGEKACDYLERAERDAEAPKPDILLLDLNLPKRDGFEVLRRLRASAALREIPVVVLTSSDAPHDIEQVRELGAKYFRKAPNYAEFMKLGGVLAEVLQVMERS